MCMDKLRQRYDEVTIFEKEVGSFGQKQSVSEKRVQWPPVRNTDVALKNNASKSLSLLANGTMVDIDYLLLQGTNWTVESELVILTTRL